MHDNGKTFCDYIDAMIHTVPLWVYGIALFIIIIGSIIAFLKRGKREGMRISACLFLLLYIVVFLCSTVLFRAPKTKMHYPFNFLWHYQSIGQGQVLFFPEIIMNIVVFVPIGFAISVAFRKIRGWQVLLAGMGFSVGIELLQWLFKKGFADVDDVIHNTLGCMVGYLLYRVMKRVVLDEQKFK